MKRVFIDGKVGTTGLQIDERLQKRDDIELVFIEDEYRKDPVRKSEIINSVDLAILCLPDEASRESVSLIKNPHTKVIDASTAHRIDPSWAYGFPELGESFREKIATSQFIANPGCHATGFIALAYPLIKSGVLPLDYPATITSLTGYSGAGKSMIERYKGEMGSNESWTVRPYGLQLNHKHLPEMRAITGLSTEPHFYPVISNFEKGMLVSFPIFTRLCNGKTGAGDIYEKLATHYENEHFIRVQEFNPFASLEESTFLTATDCNDTNFLDIFVFGNDDQALLVARLDNLGKGASGAAVQNMNCAFGLDEKLGL